MRRVLALAACVALAGCGAAAFRPFPMAPVLWRDDDMQPFSPRPSVNYNAWGWNAADNTIFRQASQVLTYERAREAIDVNALDEVPDSSWYTNRVSRWDVGLDALRQGACPSLAPPPPPYVIVRGKFSGSSPGAVIRAGDGRQYVLKVDFDAPERGTAADVISTRLVYAAGYDTPCDIVLYVRPDELAIAPHAMRSKHGSDPYTQADLDALLHEADAGRDGTRRISLSLYIEGDLLGGFDFDGLRADDPNDVVPHEHRRELRAFYVLSAWMNHIDARPENNIDVWVGASANAEPGRGYVHHVILDAGDSFGIVWDQDVDDGMGRRFGNAHYLDLEQMTGDLFTLGAADRAYRNARRGPAFDVLGWYDVERFDPSQWRNGHPNPAFERRTEADCAWMARILSRFDEPMIRAIVDVGQFSRPLVTNELVRILMGRRDRILERYLVRLSPLSFPEIDGDSLCLRDLAVESGLRPAAPRAYTVRRYTGLPPRAATPPAVHGARARVCVALPHDGGPWRGPRYHVVDVFAGTPGRETSHPARVHLWETASHTFLVAGLERPDDDAAP